MNKINKLKDGVKVAGSKNNPNSRKDEYKVKLVYSNDCEVCTEKCNKGEKYLESFKAKGWGKGVVCYKI
jgi:hypothetical protein